jgi:hypothetical protein
MLAAMAHRTKAATIKTLRPAITTVITSPANDDSGVSSVKSIAMTLVMTLFACAVARSAENGDWTYGRSDDRSTFFAFTTNDSGAVLGEWCGASTGKCSWMIGLTTMCEQNSSYPILANSDTGAASVMITCGGKVSDTNLSRYQFTSYKDVESLLQGSKRIGFAIPMQLDQFRVVRFSLDGAVQAVENMERQVVKNPAPRKPDTKDTVL